MLGGVIADPASKARERLVSASLNDYSASFATIRGQVKNSHGVRLTDFVRELKPIYWRSRLDIALGYAALIAILASIEVGQAIGVPQAPLVIGGALLIGYWFLYLVSLLHEGVHWHLAKNRKDNDLLCKLLLTWLVGVNLDAYRHHHFEHHRSLGTVHDTQTSYFSPLNLRMMLRSLLGIRTIQAFRYYIVRSREYEKEPGAGVPNRAVVYSLLLGVAAHAMIVAGLWFSGATAAALAWVIGVAVAMPFFNTVRQVLEHRHEAALAEVDYSMTDQGACSRMFGNGLFDRTFGAAGANRHLLHHWEPQVSYTRLPDLERFLADTPVGALIDRRRTTYFAALVEFLSYSSGANKP